ncbi:MAG: YcjX family protein [Aestuariivirga sp.]
MKFQNAIDAGRIAAGGFMDLAMGLVNPTLRLGVTGFSRSGKTVFITALVHAITKGTRLPVFEAYAQGRITRAYLEPQPDDDLPRFAYEDHLARLTADDRSWPEGTRRISQLRLTLEYEPRGLIARNFGSGKLHLDIVDYPGEWLLDLPLMKMTYRQWSDATIAASHVEPRASLAKAWHAHLATLDAQGTTREMDAVKAAELFTAYLAKCRDDEVALSSLLPGRFLMPGDFAGSPLLTFAPVGAMAGEDFSKGSLGDLMERRYNSYVTKIVRPFFFSHFARLDRQIVLVDTLSALNAGPAAVQDLKSALTEVLACFRAGANSILSAVIGRRIDRILFAATKADLLHQTSHDRLENILRLIIADASAKAEFSGATIDVAALAAIRATREAKVKQKNEELPCIAGVPQRGEKIDGTTFDGESEVAIFPGDLPANSLDALDGTLQGKLKFVRFRPPPLKNGAFPHIRLDRSLEFLLGDRFA